MDIKLLQKVLVKNMLKVASGAKSLQGGDGEKLVEQAMKDLQEDYKKESITDGIDLENIDWSKVKVIKENE